MLNNEITLDEWHPTLKPSAIIPSKWRTEQIKRHPGRILGIDEIKKVKMHINRKVPDEEIIKVFRISIKILDAIKRNEYSPVLGLKKYPKCVS